MSGKTGADYPVLKGRALLGVPVDDLPMDDDTATMMADGFARMDELDRAVWAMSMPGRLDGSTTILWRRFKTLPLIGTEDRQ